MQWNNLIKLLLLLLLLLQFTQIKSHFLKNFHVFRAVFYFLPFLNFLAFYFLAFLK